MQQIDGMAELVWRQDITVTQALVTIFGRGQTGERAGEVRREMWYHAVTSL